MHESHGANKSNDLHSLLTQINT